MFLDIKDPQLDAALDELVAAQPSGTSRRALVRSILERVTGAYRASGDPLGWMSIGPANDDSGKSYPERKAPADSA